MLKSEVSINGLITRSAVVKTNCLDALGIRDPNEGLSEPKYRTAANIIFGGNRERMLELAFGNQDYDTISRTKDHSHLKRMPEIEEWANVMLKS